MTKHDCALCGTPTASEAMVGDNYYCHTECGATCYLQATWSAEMLSIPTRIDFTAFREFLHEIKPLLDDIKEQNDDH